MATQLRAVALVLLSTVLASSGSAFYKIGADALRQGYLDIALFIGAVLYITSAGLLVLGLKWGELSVLYPIYGLNYVWASIIAIYIFHEAVSLVQWAGIGALISGVALIGMGGRQLA